MESLSRKIIIVWSGAAGLRCALHLREHGERDLLIVGDRAFDDPHTTQARWWINAALHTMDEEDTPLIHAVDTFREWQELAHPDLVEILADNAPHAIQDLLDRGAEFHKEQDWRLTQRFFGAHSYRRTVFSGDETGKEMIRVMSARALDLEIPYLENTYVYDLIVDGSNVRGVKAIDKKTDTELEILAPIVVFATWGYSNVYRRSSSRNKENFGDGLGIAFRAGAQLGDIELVQFHPTWLLYPEEKFGELVTEAMRGEWAKLINNEGKQFMIDYDPIKLELSTRDVVARANFQEIQEWRGTERGWVFLDISHRPLAYILERLPKMHQMILKYNNVDISKDPVEVAPTTHYTMGGIWFDPQSMKTNISWFFVAGECSMWVHGANRLGGNSLMETMVFGKKIAQAILEKTKTRTTPKQIRMPARYTDPVLVSKLWMDAQDTLDLVRKKVRDLAGIVRKEKELLELQNGLTALRRELLSDGILPIGTRFEQVMMYTRLRSVIHLALLICNWALARKESRGAHYRSDFPELHKTYSKNLMHSLSNNKIISQRRDVPKASSNLQAWLEEFERTQNYGHSE